MEWIFDLLEEYWWVVAIALACIGWFVFSFFFGESSDDDYPSCAHGGCY